MVFRVSESNGETTAARKYVGKLGSSGDNPREVRHCLGTRDVIVQAFDDETRLKIPDDGRMAVEIKDDNTVTVGFSPAKREPFTVIVIG